MLRRIALDPRRNYLLVVLVLSLAFVAACSSSRDASADMSITGQVIGIEARDIARFDSLAVIDENRKIWQFTGGTFTGFTPSHLREHQATGDLVTVWFVEDGDALRVTRIEDGG